MPASESKDEIIKEIKAIFRVQKYPGKQLPLGWDALESPGDRALKSFLKNRLDNQRPLFLSEVTSQFVNTGFARSEAYRWQTVLCLAKLYRDEFIHLLVENNQISGKAAVKFLTKEENWSKLQIVSQIPPANTISVGTRKIVQELFGEVNFQTEESLARFIRGNLKGWNKALNRCDEKACTGNYPGKKAIFDFRSVLMKLLAIEDPAEFIQNFEKKRDELVIISKQIRSLDHFYKNYMDTWKVLCNALEDLQPNRPFLEKLPEISEKMRRMEQILSAPKPYGMVDEIDGLVAEVCDANRQLVQKHRQDVCERIDKYISQLIALLDANKISADLRNGVLHPLRLIKKKLHAQFHVPGIQTVLKNAREHYEESMDKIVER